MAKIVITADTEKLTMNCSVDGEDIPNLKDVSLYLYPESEYSKARLHFSACSSEKTDNGVSKVQYTYANKLEKNIVVKGNEREQIAARLANRGK